MLRVLGQIAASFIIAEGPDGMYLIDQHAAHERVLYERILTQLRERAVDRQTLLDPLVVDLTSEEIADAVRSKRARSMASFANLSNPRIIRSAGINWFAISSTASCTA